MDFHLYCREGRERCNWLASPGSDKTINGEPNSHGNFDVVRQEGNLVGIIVGWSDMDIHQLWLALHDSDLVGAKSILASAEGTFAGVFEVKSRIYIVTDVAGSIPVFFGYDQEGAHVASKADLVAHAAENKVLDPVAIADFIQNGAVCHPFTLFKAVKVAPPGSISYIEKRHLISSRYWGPHEEKYEGKLEKAASELRETIRTVLQKGLQGSSDVTVMFSGGEDARSLVPLLPDLKNYRLRLIAGGKNREYSLARRSARALGLPVEVIVRESDHYRKQFTEKVQWVGAGNDVRHFHVFSDTAAIMDFADAAVGGLGSDRLFKSDYIFNVSHKAKQSFLPERLLEPDPDRLVGVGLLEDMKWMRPEIAESVWQRRLAHHKVLRRFRPKSAGNWHTLWPLGGHSQAHSQFLNNVRYGPRVVEPFIAASTYKLAAITPDEWKVDRKVFTAAFVPVMGKAAWVTTTAGRVPALNGLNGRLIQFIIKSWRVLYDGLQNKLAPLEYGDQGPWSGDHKGFEFNPGDYLDELQLYKLNQSIEELIARREEVGVFWSEKGAIARERRVKAIQVAQAISDD